MYALRMIATLSGTCAAAVAYPSSLRETSNGRQPPVGLRAKPVDRRTENYREKVDPEVVMVLPHPPFVYRGAEAISAVAATPVWNSAELTERQVSRPQEGIIVVGYPVKAQRDHEVYEAHCTSTMRRLEHEVWRVVSISKRR